jgi:hypothetical protein
VAKKFESFGAFYPVYLRMHDNRANQQLHLLGNALGLLAIGAAIGSESWWVLLAAPVLAQACSWVGHASFQHNRPGVFAYPLYGMLGSWRMSWDIARGRLSPTSATSLPSSSS